MKINKQLFQKFSFQFWFGLFLLVSLIVTIQLYFGGFKTYANDAHLYTEYNNYIIFKQSFFHLLNNQNLYELYPNEQWDFYKYTPSFSFLFSAFAYLPNFFGLFFWNFLNCFILFYAIYKIDFINNKAKNFILIFNLFELFTSIQNAQSNALIAGLIILALVFAQKEKLFLATLCVVLTVYIKIFGGLAFIIFLFYPNKLKSILYAIFWTIFIGLLPLFIVSFQQLTQQYSNWFALLKADKDASFGYSVFGWLKTWFNIDISKNILVALGLLINIIPLIHRKYYTQKTFQLLYAASLLVWVVIFNHKAESPTFIIATIGITIWYCLATKSTLNTVLLVLVLLFTCLSPTDIFPKTVRDNFVVPFVLKGVACIFVWFKMMWDLVFFKEKTTLI